MNRNWSNQKANPALKNWKNKVETIQSTLNRWNYRDLTMQGRILIIKTLALTQAVYLVSSLCVPDWVINEINKDFFSFIWKYGRDKISRRVLISEFEKGGLKMIDFRSFCLASKAIWSQRLLNSNNETWTIIPKKYMDKCGIEILMSMNIERNKYSILNYHNFMKRSFSVGIHVVEA